MQENELHKLGKTELLTIIYEQEKQIEQLKKDVKDLNEQLEDRTIKIKEAGSIADASMKINKIFEVAQQAADEYLRSIKEVNKVSQESAEFEENITNDEVSKETIKQEKIEDKNTDEIIKNNVKKETNKLNSHKELNQLILINKSISTIKPKLIKRIAIFFVQLKEKIKILTTSIRSNLVFKKQELQKALKQKNLKIFKSKEKSKKESKEKIPKKSKNEKVEKNKSKVSKKDSKNRGKKDSKKIDLKTKNEEGKSSNKSKKEDTKKEKNKAKKEDIEKGKNKTNTLKTEIKDEKETFINALKKYIENIKIKCKEYFEKAQKFCKENTEKLQKTLSISEKCDKIAMKFNEKKSAIICKINEKKKLKEKSKKSKNKEKQTKNKKNIKTKQNKNKKETKNKKEKKTDKNKSKKESKDKEKKFDFTFLKKPKFDVKNVKISLQDLEKELKRRKEKANKAKFVRTITFSSVVIIAFAIIAATRIFNVLQVSGNSMEPSLYAGDLLISTKIFGYEKGDIIAFYYNNSILIKRIIATEGDIVYIDDEGNVYVNSQKIEENYVQELAYGNCDITFPYKVPDKEVFVLGDNRQISVDSRSKSIGSVSDEKILGKIAMNIKHFLFY